MCALSMWPSATASDFSRNLVMFFSVILGHVEKFPLFTNINRVYLDGLNITLVRNSKISFILLSGNTTLICCSLTSLQIHRWHFSYYFSALTSFILHNLVLCYLYPSITWLSPFVTLIMVLSSVIVHPLYASTGNYKRFWVKVVNLYSLRASLFKVDTFISACKVDTIWYRSGCTSCNAEAVQSLFMGVSLL